MNKIMIGRKGDHLDHELVYIHVQENKIFVLTILIVMGPKDLQARWNSRLIRSHNLLETELLYQKSNYDKLFRHYNNNAPCYYPSIPFIIYERNTEKEP
jgi:hypothetical protein